MYAAAGNPRRTQSSGKKTIYGWTLVSPKAKHPQKGKKMIPDEIKQVVKSRYSKFAETGGSKDSC